MSNRRLISSGSQFEQKIGYSRAVADGRWVFVSGTTGFDYATMTISDNVVEQADQCFRNIAAALAQAGASLADVVRVHYLITRREDFEPSGRCCRSTLAMCGRPARSLSPASSTRKC
jgi:enamine deaminase RidA (YjgF/YER057c/UK114 family)